MCTGLCSDGWYDDCKKPMRDNLTLEMILNLYILVVIKLTEIYFLPLLKYNPTKVFRELKSASFYRGLFVDDVGSAVSVNMFGMLLCVCLYGILKVIGHSVLYGFAVLLAQ